MAEFVVTSHLIVDREKASAFREAHHSYMKKLKDEGKMRLAGRFVDGTGGMYILIADTQASAKELADLDPYHSSRSRAYELREWEQRF
jgi:uncharacterized protein YciI